MTQATERRNAPHGSRTIFIRGSHARAKIPATTNQQQQQQQQQQEQEQQLKNV